MSKRLRASMRAVNKGRNLRPRAINSQPPPPDAHADESPSTSPSADLRTHETLREPVLTGSNRPDAPDAGSDEDAAEAAPEAIPQPSKPLILPKAMASEPPAEETKSATPAQVPPPAEAFTKAEPPKPEAKPEPAKVEAAKPEPAKVEAKRAEPAKAEPPKAELAKAEPPKVEPKKAEPAKVEAKKAAEPAKVEAKKAEPAKVEAKKVAPAKVEEAKKAAPASKKPEPAKAAEKAPASRKGEPASRRSPEDDLDASSISAEFFRKDQDSVPPVEEHYDEIDVVPHIVLSPATLARRARLRRLVAGVVAFAGVISIAVVSKAIANGKRQNPMPTLAVEAKREAPSGEVKPAVEKVAANEAKPAAEAKKDDAKPEEAKKDDAKPEEAKKDEAKPEEAKKGDEAKKDEAKKDDAKPEEAKKDDAKKDDAKDAKKDDAKPEEAKAAPSAADIKALKKETESLLNRGKNKDAIEKAKELIAADPTDASGYLFLGAALQETGKWKDGIEAYCECVRNSTKGPINECRQMGGHK